MSTAMYDLPMILQMLNFSCFDLDFKNIPQKCDWLFFREESGKYNQIKSFRKAFVTSLKKAGILDFRFHDLRHIAATNLYLNGNSERQIMQIAGQGELKFFLNLLVL